MPIAPELLSSLVANWELADPSSQMAACARQLRDLLEAGSASGSASGGRVTPPALGNPSGPVLKDCSVAEPDLPIDESGKVAEPEQSFGRVAKCVGARVDALYLAFQVDVDDLVAGELFDPKLKGKRCWTTPSGLALCVRNTKSPDVLMLENADLRGRLDVDDSTGFGLELIARATYLATEQLCNVLATLVRLAEDLGKVRGFRVRRLDLAGDFADWPLEGIALDAWLAQRRAGIVDYAEVPVEMHHQAARLTGFTVGKSALRMRVYDKRQELRFRADAEKTETEERRWKAAGWDGMSTITRIEFQLRGVAMDQLELRDATELERRIDPVWQYLTREWVRLAVPRTATQRKNWKLDPRWLAVRDVQFLHKACPAERKRCRGGARIRYTRGCLLSAVVARVDPGPAIRPKPPETKVLGDAHPGQQDAILRAIRANDRRLVEFFLQEAVDDRVREWGTDEAYNRQVVELDAARARFWSIRDGPLDESGKGDK
jgi:hypothetical protein